MRNVRLYRIAVVIAAGGWGLAAGLFAEEPVAPKAPQFEVKYIVGKDKFTHPQKDTVHLQKDSVTFTVVRVHQSTRADVTLTAGTWPADITVRLDEVGGYPSEFSVEADNGSVKLYGAFTRDKVGEEEHAIKNKLLWANPTVCWFDAKGKELDKLSSRAKYTMTLTRVRTEIEGQLFSKYTTEVVLPPNFCDKDVKTLRLHWTDTIR